MSASIVTAIYGVLTTLAGLIAIWGRKIQPWSAIGMAISGLILVLAAIMLIGGIAPAPYLIFIGLLAIHLLAINNGLKMYGKINPRHHLARLALSLFILGLTFWAQF
jgi:hypothetical protein